MTRFEPNKPIVTRTPAIVVDAGLPPGEYRFRLIVQDDQGQQSVADEQIVRVVERRIIRRTENQELRTENQEPRTENRGANKRTKEPKNKPTKEQPNKGTEK